MKFNWKQIKHQLKVKLKPIERNLKSIERKLTSIKSKLKSSENQLTLIEINWK